MTGNDPINFFDLLGAITKDVRVRGTLDLKVKVFENFDLMFSVPIEYDYMATVICQEPDKPQVVGVKPSPDFKEKFEGMKIPFNSRWIIGRIPVPAKLDPLKKLIPKISGHVSVSWYWSDMGGYEIVSGPVRADDNSNYKRYTIKLRLAGTARINIDKEASLLLGKEKLSTIQTAALEEYMAEEYFECPCSSTRDRVGPPDGDGFYRPRHFR